MLESYRAETHKLFVNSGNHVSLGRSIFDFILYAQDSNPFHRSFFRLEFISIDIILALKVLTNTTDKKDNI